MKWIVMICVLVCSCRSVKYVEVPSVKVEREYSDRWHRDSIFVKDSVMVMVKGDTVWMDRWRVEWRDRWRTDSVVVRDSVVVTKVVEVPVQLTWWQRWKMALGGWTLAAVVVAVTMRFFKRRIL